MSRSYAILFSLLGLTLFLLVSCNQSGQAEEAAAQPVATWAVPAEMAPEEALTLALECEGHMVGHTLEYVVRDSEKKVGFETAQAALQGYLPSTALPAGTLSQRAEGADQVVWIYQQGQRAVGKVLAEKAADGSWVITQIINCMD